MTSISSILGVTTPRSSAVIGKATLSLTDVRALTTTQVATLTATQIASLTSTNVKALSAGQISALSTAAVTGFTSTQAGYLAATQVAAFKTTQLAAFTSTTASGLSGDDIKALSTTQIGALSAKGVGGLNSGALSALSSGQVGALGSTAIAALSTTQINGLSSNQFAALGATQTRALVATQLNGLNDVKIAALSASALTAAQLGGLDGTHAAKLTTTQLKSLAATQIGALSTTASSALTSTQVAALGATQLAAMKSITVGSAGGLRINLIWGATTAKAPADFRNAVITAAKSFTDTYSNNATINIQVGFGETNGTAVSSSAVAQSMSRGSFTTYGAVRTALLKDSANSTFQATADATLGTSDPTAGGQFYVGTAQQKALGMMGDNSAIDGYIGLSSVLAMDYSHSGAAGKFDAVGAMQHEISEVLGRTGSVGKAMGAKTYTALDLFRYKGNNARSTTATGSEDYFSIDGGKTNLGSFNTTNASADYADWSAKEMGDAYGYGSPGVKGNTTARDIIEMAAIGYNLTSSGLAAAQGSGLSANLVA